MTNKLSDKAKASRKRAKWLAEFRATLTDDELNEENLRGMGLGENDIDALLGREDSNPEIVDAEVISVEDESDLSADEPMEREKCVSRLPAVIPGPIEKSSGANGTKHTQWSEEWWANAKPEVQARRCKAHKKDGSQCRQPALKMTTVCRYHGGAAKHVKAAARARLENATDRMAKELLGMAIDPTMSPAVKLSAIKDALDRGGLKPTETVVVSPGQQTGFDEIFDDIYSGPKIEHDSPGFGIEQPSATVDYAVRSRETESHSSTSPSGERLSCVNGADHQGYSNVDYGPREYGRPARPGVHVSGLEAMRIAREAQEISRRLAGLDEDRFNSEI
ncbi:hypothetical protein ACP6C7_29100 [Mycolicibacterium septicum]|uniref:Uncharacterized protein n=1 Tax=Mycolicibacterium septicum TaxID=98668 RepID=A0ABW9M0X8_9MYCO